ncbi:DUF3108 domain-containing protein, partial [Ottowia sp.]|uniref:DUF3108 domain-containing protein n=1 Tax=Ottowia sp. TaxID=1898956 RepID=UPI0039E6C7D2
SHHLAPAPARGRRRARVAGPLTSRGFSARGPLLASLLLALLLHALALALLQRALQAPSLLQAMAPPFYTRTLAPEAPAPMAAPQPAEPTVSKPNRPSALIRRAQAAPKKRAKEAPAPEAVAAPESPASAAVAEVPPDTPTVPEPETLAQAEPVPEPAPPAPASGPQPAASAPEPAFLATWPGDTRLTYRLSGHYRGELHGSARVLWQRTGTRYQAVVEMSAGLLASLAFSSQGEITDAGLHPEVYEETVRQRRRGVRLDADELRLNNGERVARPPAVQDTASQFVELGHRFATGEIRPAPGVQIRFALARPGGVDEWTYDVVGEETLHLPRLGPVAAWHLKPRRLDRPRGPLTAEMWFAPALQYLPVRIRITQSEDTYLDLLVETIEQR